MSANKVAVELTLEDQLAIAERDLECARMIDNTARMWAEVDECRRRVDALKKKIADRDERLSITNACAALGDLHAG